MDLYSWRELLHPEDLEKSDRFLADHLSGRQDTYECEIRVRRKNGSWAWVLDRGKVTERTSDGEPLLLSGTVQDITERKRNEDALEQSQRQLATLMGNLPGMAYRCLNDPYWTMLFVSEGCLGLTGYSSEDLIENRTLCYADLIRPADEDKVWKKVQQGLEQSGSFEVEYRIVTAEGKEKHVWEQGTYVYEEEGVQFLEGFITDITDRKQAEEAIDNERAYLSAVIDNIEEAIVICDAEGRIVRFNEAARLLHGLPEQPIPSDKWAEHYNLYQEDGVTPLPQEEIPLFRALQGERVSNAEIVVAPKHNHPYDLVCSGQALTDETGTLIGAVVAMHDITERKQMEKKLKEMSLKDSLTGLYNRNFFEEEMKRLSDGRYNPLGVIVCDLDGLKFVNDTLGHKAGDQMLVNTAELLRQNFRSSDIIARIGGDEFTVLLTKTDPEVVELMLGRLRQSVQDYNKTKTEIPLSLSMGHALGAGETADMHAIFREADNRMYREKIQREGSARNAILQALLYSMQARDFDTEGHCDRLQDLAASLAYSLGSPQEFINDLSLLARFHDLGKVGIPDHILFKPGPLTEDEWQQMCQHCEIGHRIASSVPDLEPIADYILKHHEHFDGQGYPLGLSGEDIPLPCRILAISDAYDAMTSDRPYRKAMTREQAIDELQRCAGTQFDPDLVQRFIRILEDSHEAQDSWKF
jgi:diguanylate cyclase (GGDEF)-like protein/PAS domain S-box-containing protein